MLPADEGASEGAGLDRVVLVLEVVAELGYPLEGEVGIAVRVELAHRFLGLPAGGHVAMGITGTKLVGIPDQDRDDVRDTLASYGAKPQHGE